MDYLHPCTPKGVCCWFARIAHERTNVPSIPQQMSRGCPALSTGSTQYQHRPAASAHHILQLSRTRLAYLLPVSNRTHLTRLIFRAGCANQDSICHQKYWSVTRLYPLQRRATRGIT